MDLKEKVYYECFSLLWLFAATLTGMLFLSSIGKALIILLILTISLSLMSLDYYLKRD